ncbi:hypothetical protein [Fusobacterium nucleatum]|uniref:hypothetical protein n=1 Tax=Fusobacterium nucleatum TaxID=851 RepID=UPI00123A4A68|nr:hypothetical protein [Fusobacterium nucleatum]
MKAKVIQEFKGEINGIEFTNEQIYRTSEYLIENIENKFGETSKDFIEDLKNSIERAAYKYDTFDFKVFEESVIDSLNEAKTAKELKVNYGGIDWKMELINKNLRENKYIFKIEKEIERNSWENKIDKDKSKGLGR